MAARLDNGRVQLLTRTGLDWTAKYPSAVEAFANVNVKTAYLDGELCGVDEAGLPSFAQTQAATDGERNVHLVYYAFDLLHIGGWDVSVLPLDRRKALLEPLLANTPGLQFNGHVTGDGELILKQAGKLGFEGIVSNGELRAWSRTDTLLPRFFADTLLSSMMNFGFPMTGDAVTATFPEVHLHTDRCSCPPNIRSCTVCCTTRLEGRFRNP
jgi:hypothetical protein